MIFNYFTVIFKQKVFYNAWYCKSNAVKYRATENNFNKGSINV
jgi:hypothetical protein